MAVKLGSGERVLYVIGRDSRYANAWFVAADAGETGRCMSFSRDMIFPV